MNDIANIKYCQPIPLASKLPGMVFKPSLTFSIELGVGEGNVLRVLNLQAMKTDHVERWIMGLQAVAMMEQRNHKKQGNDDAHQSLFFTCSQPISHGKYLWMRTRSRVKELAKNQNLTMGQLLKKAIYGIPIVSNKSIL